MLPLSFIIPSFYRPITTFTILLKPACPLLIITMATTGLLACENRTQPDSNVNVPAVEIEQTAPLVAGSSVGSANISIDAVPTDSSDSNANLVTNVATDKAASTANINNAKGTPAPTTVLSDSRNPVAFKLKKDQPSIVSSKVAAIKDGTPEATLKNAVNTLYYGDAQQAVGYYETDIPDFGQQLANTQQGFKENVQKITLTEVIYNQDKTKAVVKGSITLAGRPQPDSAEFRLRKVNGEWKILG